MKSFISSAPVGKLGLLFAFAAGLIAPVFAEADVEITRATAAYRESRQFYRISEFFTNRENTGSDIILRSQPENRAGFYFTVRMKPYPYLEDVEEAVLLEVIMPGDIEPTLFTFSLGPGNRRHPLVLVGLTGDDWPDPSAQPLAWRISFADAEGDIIVREQSFLWSKE